MFFLFLLLIINRYGTVLHLMGNGKGLYATMKRWRIDPWLWIKDDEEWHYTPWKSFINRFYSVSSKRNKAFYSLSPNKKCCFYFVDNGLLHLFISNPNTSLLENLCAITLYKKYGKGLYYYNKNIEVDFYVPDEQLAVQASYQMSDGLKIEIRSVWKWVLEG